MYALVQQFAAEGTYQGLPVPALVEDDNGVRLLLAGPLIGMQVWSDAQVGGAAGVLRVLGAPLAWVDAETFQAYRKENQFVAAHELDELRWSAVDPGLTVFEMQAFADNDPAHFVSQNPFVHLHCHSDFSALDGYSTMDEIVALAVADKQRAVAITDHGTCTGHPALRKASEGLVRPIYGMEANFVDDRHDRTDRDYYHLVVWAQTDEGLINLWALSTEGERDGFYYRPRIDWESLQRWGTGLAVSTACLRGPLFKPHQEGNEQLAIANLARLGEIFPDRLYIEIHTNQMEHQIRANGWAVEIANRYHVPLLAVVDSHYATAEEKGDHQAWMAGRTGKDVGDEQELFADNQDYHLMTCDEVRKSLSYLPDSVTEEAIANTGRLADSCVAEIVPHREMPTFSVATPEHPDRAQHDVERFLDKIIEAWPARITGRVKDERPYLAQLEHELPMLIDKGFAGYFLMTADYVQYAKKNGVLVGPGRGSGAASLAAYMLGITEVDPIKTKLLFDRFMTEGRTSLPDFDVDFPSSRADFMINYIQQRWGVEHVARVGTHIRIKNRGAFKFTQRAISSRLPGTSYAAVEQISKIIEQAEASTAGLGLSWDELIVHVGDQFDKYREEMPELFRLAEQFHGRLTTYSKHAAGVIIDPDHSLIGTLPMRRGGDDDDAPMVTQFDMDALEYLGEVKFDFLYLRQLDTIQECVDLIRSDTGDVISPYEWTDDQYTDPLVYEELANGWTMGLFQLETSLGTRTTKLISPTQLEEIADIIALGRPGPMRSGLDKLYLRRRSGEEVVTFPDDRLQDVLSRTYAVMLYQEDIMAVCLVLAGYSSDEADDVRRILGKKKVDQAAAEGEKFVRRAIENATQPDTARQLWEQMAEFAKYSFNRGHAQSYATLSYWGAWLKTHYPKEFLIACMLTIKKERVPQFVAEARRLGYQVLPPDINASREKFTADGLVIRYGLSAVGGIGDAAAGAVIVGQPYVSYEDFIERRGPQCNIGHVKRLVHVGAFDSLEPNRRALDYRIEADANGTNTQCVFKDLAFTNEHGLPCHFDWASEPLKLGKTGKVLKTQPKIPAKCTRACRHFTPREPDTFKDKPFYTDAEIRDIEQQMLGLYLSSSPFDVVPPDMLAELMTGDDLDVAENGSYPMVVIVSQARPDPKGRDFGFATLVSPAGEFSVIVFNREWARFKPYLRNGQLAFIEAFKSEQDRYRLIDFQPVDIT